MRRFKEGCRYVPINKSKTDKIASRDLTDYPVILERNANTVEIESRLWGIVTREIEHEGNIEVIRNVDRLYGERWDIYASRPCRITEEDAFRGIEVICGAVGYDGRFYKLVKDLRFPVTFYGIYADGKQIGKDYLTKKYAKKFFAKAIKTA